MYKYFLLILLSFSSIVSAHPHASIESNFVIIFEKNTPIGINVELSFDQAFSSDLFSVIDTNNNGIIDFDESEIFAENEFSDMTYGYFFYQRIGNEKIHAWKIEKFSAKMIGEKLIFSYLVSLEQSKQPIAFYLYDSSMYFAILYRETDPVVFQNAGSLVPSYKIIEVKDLPTYYNPFNGKKGYQKEVIVNF